MSTCPGCGGIVGRDCFNPIECASISESIEQQHRAMAYNANQEVERLKIKLNRLLVILTAAGIDVSCLDDNSLPF